MLSELFIIFEWASDESIIHINILYRRFLSAILYPGFQNRIAAPYAELFY